MMLYEIIVTIKYKNKKLSNILNLFPKKINDYSELK